VFPIGNVVLATQRCLENLVFGPILVILCVPWDLKRVRSICFHT